MCLKNGFKALQKTDKKKLSLLPFIIHLRRWCFELYGRLCSTKGEFDLLQDNGECKTSLKAMGIENA
jgi:hypothetical protein